MKFGMMDYSSEKNHKLPFTILAERTELIHLAEKYGYHRFWVAGQRNDTLFIGNSPENMVSHLVTATERIRVGAGNLLIPYYNAEKIIANFKVLGVLHPNRLDIGLGQAAKGSKLFSQTLNEESDQLPAFAGQIQQLQEQLLKETLPEKPEGFREKGGLGNVLGIEFFILGSSDRNIQLAAETGAGFMYAHYINPSGNGEDILQEYRNRFTPAALGKHRKVMIGVFVIVRETEEEAEKAAKEFDAWYTSPKSGGRTVYQNGVKVALLEEVEDLESIRQKAIIGTADTVWRDLRKLGKRYHADEIIIIPDVHSDKKRKQTIELMGHVL